MDKLENGIKMISLNDISYDNFIQNFSKINLTELKLEDNKELLIGYLPFKIKKPKIPFGCKSVIVPAFGFK